MQPTSHDCFEKPSNGCLSQREFGFFSILSDSYLKREQLTCESGSKCDSSLRLHLRLQSSALSVHLTTDSLSCHDAERRHPVRGSVWPIFALLTFHHEYSRLRARVFDCFTAQHFSLNLRPPVRDQSREWGLCVWRLCESATRPAADPDETGGKVHTSASEWIHLTLRHVR